MRHRAQKKRVLRIGFCGEHKLEILNAFGLCLNQLQHSGFYIIYSQLPPSAQVLFCIFVVPHTKMLAGSQLSGGVLNHD